MPEINKIPALKVPRDKTGKPVITTWLIIYWGRGCVCQRLPTESWSLMWVVSPFYVWGNWGSGVTLLVQVTGLMGGIPVLSDSRDHSVWSIFLLTPKVEGA